MARSWLYFFLGLLAVFYLPWWWLTIAALIAVAALIETPFLVLLLALLFDLLYGQIYGAPTSFVGLLSITLAIPLIFFSKKLIRFN